MSKKETILDPRQQEVLALLVAGNSVQQAAESANVSRSAIYRWRKIPAFAQALADAQKRVLGSALQVLEDRSADLVRVVLELATDPSVADATRLQAAKTGLQLAVDHNDRELEAKVAELSDQLEALQSEWQSAISRKHVAGY